jgi:hypothetical protein
VSLVLASILILVLSSLVLPLRVNRNTNVETTGAAIARSYIELVKSKWQVATNYSASILPVADTTATADIKLPTGWELVVDGKASWTNADTIRTLKVIVKPTGTTAATTSKEWVIIETLITKPS